MSGLLYTLAIEPLLCQIWHRLSGLIVPGTISGIAEVKVSAYADDLTVVLHNQEDLQNLASCIETYGQASSARVNWEKSGDIEGFVGSWQGMVPHR